MHHAQACPSCGHRVDDDAVLCTDCGTRLRGRGRVETDVTSGRTVHRPRKAPRLTPRVVTLAQTAAVVALLVLTIAFPRLLLLYATVMLLYAGVAGVLVYLCNARVMGPIGALIPWLWMWKTHGDPWYSRLPHHDNRYVCGVLNNAVLGIFTLIVWGAIAIFT